MTNSVDSDQTAPIGAVCSGSTLFASIEQKNEILTLVKGHNSLKICTN